MVTQITSSKLELTWLHMLHTEFLQPYMLQLQAFLEHETSQKKIIYPPCNEIFNAFHLTPLPQVKVVIVGQDPYHGPNQAHGLCFSVRTGIAIPPSLRNIYKELEVDLDVARPQHGCLEHWAQQGVLLLNSVLTVAHGKAHSHQNKGWEHFTDQVIKILNQNTRQLVFLLWGAYAINKGKLIDSTKHLVLTAPHPSPLSAYQGFFGCKHFSKTNNYLAQWNEKICW